MVETMSDTTLKVKRNTRDRVNKLLSPGETVDGWLNKFLPREEEFDELNQLRESLAQKAHDTAREKGKALWEDALKETQKRLGEDAVTE